VDIDGGLSTFEKRLLDRHLDGCGECRTFAEDAALFTLTLRSAPLEPAHVVVDVPRRRRRVSVSGAVASVASVAAVVAAAMLVFAPHGSTRTPPGTTALASGLATLALNADSLGMRQHELPRGTPRFAGAVRGTYGVPV
jgi:predicted anti-sigma-YlaC factor YlaD